jgi:hypothetical protein
LPFALAIEVAFDRNERVVVRWKVVEIAKRAWRSRAEPITVARRHSRAPAQRLADSQPRYDLAECIFALPNGDGIDCGLIETLAREE